MATIKGLVDKVGPYKSGKNAKGDWSLQYVTIDGRDIKVWCRPDLSSTKGRFVEIEGVDNGELKKDVGNIAVVEESRETKAFVPSTPTPASVHEALRPDKRTIDEYFRVLDMVIDHVDKKLPDWQAVASVVNGTMISYVRGEFVVPAHDQDVPF